tara:strand:+ start:26594 stop:27031 length:438 start_codon:yes stop_codon:yes gene_type:complete
MINFYRDTKIDILLMDCFNYEKKELNLSYYKVGLKGKYVRYNFHIYPFFASHYSRSSVSFTILNNEQKEIIYKMDELNELIDSCTHILRVWFNKCADKNNFVKGLPGNSNTFTCTRTQEIFNEIKSNEYYIELENRLLISKLLEN